MSMSDNVIANITNPQPILQQPKSIITTNPFIPDDQKKAELQDLQNSANQIIQTNYEQNKTSSIKDMSISNINQNVASSIMGIIEDLFNKPDDIPWTQYIPYIFSKDQRYAFIGVLFIFIAIYLSIIKT